MNAATTADAAFDALAGKIARERGFGAASYRDGCLRRRIAVRMRAPSCFVNSPVWTFGAPCELVLLDH